MVKYFIYFVVCTFHKENQWKTRKCALCLEHVLFYLSFTYFLLKEYYFFFLTKLIFQHNNIL